MINTLKNKLILIFVAITLVFTMAFAVNVNMVKATEEVTTEDYIVAVEGDKRIKKDSVISNGVLATKIDKDVNLEYFGDIVIDDFMVVFNFTDEMESLKVNLTTKGFYEDKVTNVLELKLEGGVLSATFNGEGNLTLSSRDVELAVKVVDGFIIPTVNGTPFANANDDYKVEKQETTVATLGFDIKVSGETTFAIDQITQKASDSAYLQDFTLTNGELAVRPKAIVVLNEFFSLDQNGNIRCVKYLNTTLTMTFKALNVIPEDITEDIKVVEADGVSIVKQSNGTATLILTKNNAVITLKQGENLYKEFTVQGLLKGDGLDVTAPIYNKNAKAIAQFKEQLEEATMQEGGEYHIQIGATQTLKIPTMKSMVYDDYTGYEDLKQVVYYYTPSTSSQTSSMEIPIREAGTYKFFVAFVDLEGNEMEKEDFIVEDDKGNYVGLASEYGDYVFTFTIEDDAPMTVTGSAQENGYLEVKYTAKDFDITGADYSSVYKLYYRESESKDWVEIPAIKTVTEDYDYTVLSAIGIDGKEDLEAISYNGKLTFIPTMKGEYKITCDIATTYSSRTASGETVVLVQDAVQKVNTGAIVWIENNVESFIFLTIGTLSLIGLVVVLFVKPKEKQD